MLLAHQGGLDELAFVLLPLLLFAALLLVARRRVGRLEATEDVHDTDTPESVGPTKTIERPS